MCEICRRSRCPSACPNADDPVVALCGICGRLIYASEPRQRVDGTLYHAECLDDLRGAALLARFGHDCEGG